MNRRHEATMRDDAIVLLGFAALVVTYLAESFISRFRSMG